MGNPVYLARRRISAAEWTLNLGIPSGLNLEAKDFHTVGSGTTTETYWLDSSVAGESLRARFKTICDSHADAAVFTCTFSLVTGKITIASDGATFSITWLSTALRDWLGFTGNLAGANTYTSDNPCQGAVWCESGRSVFSEWQDETDYAESRAQSGACAGIGSGEARSFASWQHEFEPPTFVASPLASGMRDDASATVPWSWRDFWIYNCTYHEPIRYYNDRDGAITSHDNGWDLKWTTKKFSPGLKTQDRQTYEIIAVNVWRHVAAT